MRSHHLRGLNQTVRDDRMAPAGTGQHDAVAAELRRLSMKGKAPRTGWTFDRDKV
jgi:hypothetical protein